MITGTGGLATNQEEYLLCLHFAKANDIIGSFPSSETRNACRGRETPFYRRKRENYKRTEENERITKNKRTE